VDWGDATFELCTEDGRVTQGPPLIKWALPADGQPGQDERKVAAWLRAKGATFTPVDGPSAASHPSGQHPGGLFWCPECDGRHTIAEIQALREQGWPCRQEHTELEPA